MPVRQSDYGRDDYTSTSIMVDVVGVMTKMVGVMTMQMTIYMTIQSRPMLNWRRIENPRRRRWLVDVAVAHGMCTPLWH